MTKFDELMSKVFVSRNEVVKDSTWLLLECIQKMAPKNRPVQLVAVSADKHRVYIAQVIRPDESILATSINPTINMALIEMIGLLSEENPTEKFFDASLASKHAIYNMENLKVTDDDKTATGDKQE